MRKWMLLLVLLSLQVAYAHPVKVDTHILRTHLEFLTGMKAFRTYPDTVALDEAAAYIREVFSQTTGRVSDQPYEARGRTYRNVICSFGPEEAPRMIVGAHYDVCGPQPGADDNASGVAGLLELARMLSGIELNTRIDLVAYSLEEPPNFRSEYMGSYIHAKSLADENVKVLGMVCLEMIGYFSDEKKSQGYPIGLMKLFYPGRADFILAAKKFCSGKFARQYGRKLKHSKALKTRRITAPKFIPGTDFSDHLNYWKFGFSVLMITDTAFYRNENYHEVTDTLETLDIGRLGQVVEGVCTALLKIDQKKD